LFSDRTPIDQLPIDQQRAEMTRRVGRDGVAAIERGEILDSTQGRRVVQLPTSETPGPRAARVVRSQGFIAGVDLGEGVIDVADTQTSGDAIAANEDDRAARRIGESVLEDGKFSGIAEVMRKRVAGRTRNDRVGRAKPLEGETQQALYEQLNRDDGPSRGGRPRRGAERREAFGVRMEPASRAELRDATGLAEGEVLDTVLDIVRMARSGAQGEAIVVAVMDLASGNAAEPAA